MIRSVRALLPLALISGWFTVTVTQEPLVQTADEASMARWLAVQGEYVGQLDADGQEIRAAVQVIALGDDNYQLSIYTGGLPGDGWNRDRGREVGADPERQGDKIVFRKRHERIEIADGALHVYGGDQHYGQLNRVVRKSETLGATPPEGATVLFGDDGSNDFEAQNGGDPVVDGLLRPGITSKQKFDGDFSVHIEFRLPFEPAKSGQGRGNSGLYLQGRYEVQMLDSFGLAGESNECGGIYGIRQPDVNMCFPPESWQTYDVDFKSARWESGQKTSNARITVRHNGVLIHDDVEIPSITTAAPIAESAEPGYLYLQDHGSPVRYRNIWVVKR
jgi:hypothetical protein